MLITCLGIHLTCSLQRYLKFKCPFRQRVITRKHQGLNAPANWTNQNISGDWCSFRTLKAIGAVFSTLCQKWQTGQFLTFSPAQCLRETEICKMQISVLSLLALMQQLSCAGTGGRKFDPDGLDPSPAHQPPMPRSKPKATAVFNCLLDKWQTKFQIFRQLLD